MTGLKPVVKPGEVKPPSVESAFCTRSETRETGGLKPALFLGSSGFTGLKPGETVKRQTPQQDIGFKSFTSFKGFTGFKGFTLIICWRCAPGRDRVVTDMRELSRVAFNRGG